MKKTNIIRSISMFLLAVSVALMWLPYGVAMRFASEPGPPMEYITFNYSYISRVPIGYGNWFPIITAILSFAVLLMFIASVARKMPNRMDSKKSVLICLSLCVIAPPLSLLVFRGAYAITVIGVTVFIIHTAALVFQIILKKACTSSETMRVE